MVRTAARIAAVASLALAVAPATGAHAKYTLKDVLISSAQPSAPAPLAAAPADPRTGMLLPAVQKVREAAPR